MFMTASFGDGDIDLMNLEAILHELSFAITKRVIYYEKRFLN